MSDGTIHQSPISLPEYHDNLAQMLNDNAAKFGDSPVYRERSNGIYAPLSWSQFQRDISAIQHNLKMMGLKRGDRLAILSRNRKEMLEIEMAVMSMGCAAVPIFAGYGNAQSRSLVDFCEPKVVIVADQSQLDKLDNAASFEAIIHFDEVVAPSGCNLVPFHSLLSESDGTQIQGEQVEPDSICLMMYTSGTMGKPKCVQLTHGNILSQQSAMRVLWNLSHEDRFLSFLPWHHSFGGIFEKYAAITNGAVLSLEDGYGKDIDTLIENWMEVRPTVFFSVPRIYQEIVTRAVQDKAVEAMLFEGDLRFIFTAAAPLPGNISAMFERKNIPVVEGWGLTETSPCCTITDPKLMREPGVVGQPIPGVSIKLASDGEILVKGPNVMKGYYHNSHETGKVLFDNGWFATGDLGEYDNTGLRLLTRKDRVFKLSNAEKVVPTEIENLITRDCAFLAHAFVAGSGKDHPVTLLFPNKSLFNAVPQKDQLKQGCMCPKNLSDLSICLTKCLGQLNHKFETKYSQLGMAMLVDHELTIENEELTPSMKLAPNVVARIFKAKIDYMYGDSSTLPENVYVISMD